MDKVAMRQSTVELSALPNQIEISGKLKISDVYGNQLIYRSLEPLEKKLPGLRKAAGKMQLQNEGIPRKDEEDYARASLWFLEQSQKLQGKSTSFGELLYIGDSIYNDGQAYHNLQNLTGWKGSAFIGDEDLSRDPQFEVITENGLCTSNRWMGLALWLGWLVEQDFALDASTAIIVDIDKTVLGAKGRNDHVIDQVRLEGIYRTMNNILGNQFDQEAFERQYSLLNQSEYHQITADNQDYLAYICLVLNAKLVQIDELVSEIQENRIDNFEQFVRWVNSRLMLNPAGGERFRQVHEAVMMSFFAGDPTPFKRFRREEYRTTIERMGNLDDSTSLKDVLESEIAITREVVELSQWLMDRGCMILCMSDKPDESACPSRHLAHEFLPLHEIETHCVGCNIREVLNVLQLG